MEDSLTAIYADLRERMLRSAAGMTVAQDEPGNVVLKTPWDEPGKKEPAWFGAVQLKKNYVSWHLMPLYAQPSLREALPSGLKKRMQGKSCFNFKEVDPGMFEALEKLTLECAFAYAKPFSAKPH